MKWNTTPLSIYITPRFNIWINIIFQKKFAQFVKDGDYKKVIHIFNKDQIVMAMRIEKISKELDMTNFEIIIKNTRGNVLDTNKF